MTALDIVVAVVTAVVLAVTGAVFVIAVDRDGRFFQPAALPAVPAARRKTAAAWCMMVADGDGA